jgi:predicted metal-dependent hydrolase
MTLQPPTPLANAAPLEQLGFLILHEIAHWFAKKDG